MRRVTTLLIWLFLPVLLAIPGRAQEPAAAEPPPTFAGLPNTVSQRRIDLLKKELLRAASYHHPAKSAAGLQQTVEAGYVRSEKVPFGPARAAVSEESCKAAAAAAAQRLADAKFQPLDEDALAKEADKLYTVIPVGQVVTVNYRINPVRVSTITGTFKGKMGDGAVIGNHRILFKDMLPPPAREKLVLQFDQQATLAKRREHVDKKLQEHERVKAEFLAAETNRLYAAELEAAAAANEQAGYIWLVDRWEAPRTIVRRMVAANLEKLQGVYDRAHPRAPTPKTPVEPVAKTADARPPEPAIDAELLVALTDDGEDEEEATALKIGDESPVATEPVPEAKPAKRAKPLRAQQADVAASDEPNRLKWAIVGVLGLIVAASGAWLGLVLRPRRRNLSRYYSTKDAAEHGFWAKVETSGGTLPHVAYAFPDYAAAFEALAQLSFVDEATPNQPIMASEEIDLGAYMQERNFIAFIGGEKMTYAMWHETTATFRGTDKTEMYRCSETPKPNLSLPDPATLPGCENQVTLERAYDGEGDDFSHYVVYSAPDRKTANTFLRHVKVHETAVQVIVQTPDGHWGKDSRGTYKE